MRFGQLLVVVVLAVLPVIGAADKSAAKKAYRLNYDNAAGFAGPGSTVRQLAEDDAEVTPVMRWKAFDEALQPWFDEKKRLRESSGLQFGLAYTATFQRASETLTDEDRGASGIFRVSGKWDLVNRGTKNSGALVFSIDNRHKYGAVAAADLANEVGYIGPTAVLFSDAGTVLVDFNWQQRFNDGDSGILIGRYDPSDYLNILGYANPWTTFQNLNVLLDSSVAYPDVGLGIGVGHWFSDNWYGIAGFNDANGKLDEIAVYQDGAEFFKYAELGWTPARDQRYLSNVNLSVWEADEREDDGIDSARGLLLSANYTRDETWMLFGRLGWSDADAPNDPQIYDRSATLGVIYHVAARTDLAGFAVNHGELAAPGLDSQTTAELFYRLQFACNLAITPSIQWLYDPALNDETDRITVFGLRLRATL